MKSNTNDIAKMQRAIKKNAESRLNLIEKLNKIEDMYDPYECEQMLFAFYGMAVIALSNESAKARTTKLNARFSTPLEEEKLLELFERIDAHIEEKHPEKHTKGFLFSDRSLVSEYLFLTDEEALEAGFLRTTLIKEAGKINQKLAKERDECISKMWLTENATAKEIAETLQHINYKNCSLSTVKRVLKKCKLTAARNTPLEKVKIKPRYIRESEESDVPIDIECSSMEYVCDIDNSAEIRNQLQCDENICVLGLAGSGKTTLIEMLCQHITKNNQKYAIVSACGCAAERAGGETIHHFFQFSPEKKDKIDLSVLEKMKSVNTLIIDEIGAVNLRLFCKIIIILQKVEKIYNHRIRLVLFGDVLQLEAVEKSRRQLWESTAWKKYINKVVFLNGSKRSIDPTFTKVIRNIAFGKNIEYSIQYLNKNIRINSKAEETLEEIGAVYLTAKRDEVDMVNKFYIDLHKKDESFSYLYGREHADSDYAEYPVQKCLPFFKGMQVMTIVNSNQYKNGTRGIIVDRKRNYLKIRTVEGKEIKVYRQRFKDRNGSQAYMDQFPIVPCYAITIHKSQGLTLDKVVLNPYTFANGQLYVALSRARKPEDIVLTRPISPSDIYVSESAVKYTIEVLKATNI